MEDRYWTWKQIRDRLSTDREEGDAQLKLGSYLKAEISYLREIALKGDVKKSVIYNGRLDSDMSWMSRFAAEMCETYKRHSHVALKLGEFDCAIRSANDALRFPGIADKKRARAHYCRGYGYLGLHQHVEAGKDFYYARDITPTDETVKRQLEAVEGRLGQKITEEMAPLETVKFEVGWPRQRRGDPRLLQAWGPRSVERIPRYGIMPKT